MKRKSRLLILLLALVFTFGILAGCAGDDPDVDEPDETTTADDADDADEPTDDPDDDEDFDDRGLYEDIDLSDPYTVHMYVLGDTPQDLNVVVDEINSHLEADYNTTLRIHFLAWSDWETRYSLVLAGGEDVDLMYTSTWAYYYSEAAKGAFMEITDDFLARAMPQTLEDQNPDSWPEVVIDGKIYAVPRSHVSHEHTLVAIRGDLREKHGIEPLTDWDSLKDFMTTIAAEETPESGIWGHASDQDNGPLGSLWDKIHEVVPLNKAGIVTHHTYTYGDGSRPSEDDFFFYWDSEMFREFCRQMVDLREAGVWSQDAITNTVSSHDAFANDQGATILWNDTVFSYGRRVEQDIEGAEVEYYDLSEDAIVYPMPYVNDCFAIAAASRNPDRAGMVLDLLKNDTKYYRLIMGGIEGQHYIQVDEEFREEGPDRDNFPWGGFAWGLSRDDLMPSDTDPREIEMGEKLEQRMVAVPTSGFVFTEEPVRSEIAAINSLQDEYYGILTLGMADDPDATIDEMVARMENAGLADLQEEGFRQYEAWLETVD